MANMIDKYLLDGYTTAKVVLKTRRLDTNDNDDNDNEEEKQEKKTTVWCK